MKLNTILLLAIVTLAMLFGKTILNSFVEAADYQNKQSERYQEKVCQDAMNSPIINEVFIEQNCR